MADFSCAEPGCTAVLIDTNARKTVDRLTELRALTDAMIELDKAGWGWDSGRQCAWCPEHREAHGKACMR